MRFRSFTLIELLITITLFMIAITVIFNILFTSLKVMDTLIGGDSSKTSALLLIRVLENTLRESYNISLVTNNTYLIDSFDNRKYYLYLKENTCYLSEIREGKFFNTRVFDMANAEEIQMNILKAKSRLGFSLAVEFKYGTIGKTFILGYQNK